MTRTNQLTSPHLRPPTADLNRLLAGERSCIALDANRSGDIILFAQTSLHAPPELMVATLSGNRERCSQRAQDRESKQTPR